MKYFLILVLLLAFLDAFNQPAPIDYSQPEMGYYTERLTFHGVWIAECEGQGCEFERDGEKCRL
jgi:hypothetical protein